MGDKSGKKFMYRTLVCLLGISLLSGCGKNNALESGDIPILAQLVVSEGVIYNFGPVEVGQWRDKVFTLLNVGALLADDLSASLYMSINYGFADGSYPGTGGTCGTQLDAGQSCTIVVRFTPQYEGDTQSFLYVSYWDGQKQKILTQPELRGKGMGVVAP